MFFGLLLFSSGMQIQSQTTLRGLTCLVNVTLVRVVDLSIPTYSTRTSCVYFCAVSGFASLAQDGDHTPLFPPLGELHGLRPGWRPPSPTKPTVRTRPAGMESQFLVKICQTKCHRLLRTQQTETIFNVHGLRSLCRVEDSVFTIPKTVSLDSVCKLVVSAVEVLV